MPQKAQIDLTCWYLNYRRIGELLGAEYLQNAPPPSDRPFAMLEQEVYAKNALLTWMQSYRPPTLQELILDNKVATPQLFTLYTRFYCTSRGPRPCLRTTLSDLTPVYKVELPYDPVHLTSQSAATELSGPRRLFVLAYIQDINGDVVGARPYAIADITPRGDHFFPPLQPWHNYLEIPIDSIDSFSQVKMEGMPAPKDLKILRDIPEASAKQAIAEILNEHAEKDWGGEQSDLFSSHITIGGKRVTAAFLLKGPAKFKPLTVADCGKNGDQIYRLFQEPADVLFLQHCHSVNPDYSRRLSKELTSR